MVQLCDAGDALTVGANSQTGACTFDAPPGQFVSAICQSGTPSALGQDTQMSECNLPMPGNYVRLACRPGNAEIVGTNTLLARCSEPSTGEYVSALCLAGDATTNGSDTATRPCRQPLATQFVTAVCRTGSAIELGRNTELELCTRLNGVGEARYVRDACVMGDSDTLGEDTKTDRCRTPAIDQFTAVACRRGDWLRPGSNGVIEDCRQPGEGQFVAAACDSGSAYVLGRDSIMDVCARPNANQYTSRLCAPGTPTEAGQNTGFTPCTQPGDGDFVVEECLPGDIDRLGRNARIVACEGMTIAELPAEAIRTIDGDFDAGTPDASTLCAGICATHILGSFTIDGTTLQTLDAFSCVREVDGDFNVTNNNALVSIDGLSDLQRVGEDIVFTNNQQLCATTIEDFINDNGVDIGGALTVADNAAVCDNDADGFTSDIDCDDDDPDVYRLGYHRGDWEVRDNDVQFCATYCRRDIEGALRVVSSTLNRIPALPCVYEVGRDVVIQGANSLVNFAGGLTALQRVGGNLTIADNTGLSSLRGLNTVTDIDGNIRIEGNVNLQRLNGLNGLEALDTSLWIERNRLLRTIDGFNVLANVNTLLIRNNPSLEDFDGLSALATVTTNLTIDNNETLLNFVGLSELTTVGGTLSIASNERLVNFVGFERADFGWRIDHQPPRQSVFAKRLGQVIRDYRALRVTNNPNLNTLGPLPVLSTASAATWSSSPIVNCLISVALVSGRLPAICQFCETKA